MINIMEMIMLLILVIHFLADFGLQTHEQAVNKYKGNKFLVYHVSVYSAIWFLASYFIYANFIKALIFAIITFIAHFITDYVTANMSKKFFDKKDFHNGFVVVGFDQMLHYLQLYITFKFLL